MKKVLFICVCGIALTATTAQAIRYGRAPSLDMPTQQLVKFLPSRNEALEKAVTVHNLMTELPSLKVMATQQQKLKSAAKSLQKIFDDLKKCNEKRFSSRFKNAGEMLKKVREAYNEKTKGVVAGDFEDKDSVVPPSLSEGADMLRRKKDIEREIVEDALTNGKKWGGKLVGKSKPLTDEVKSKLTIAGLEEMAKAEEGLHNAKIAQEDFDSVFDEMQSDFVKKLSGVGVDMPEFNAAKSADISKARKALKALKEEYLVVAKEYVTKLDEQDAAYPEAVARRNAQTKSKRKLLKKVAEQFPDAFNEMEAFEQQAPQRRQEALILALERDSEGKVFLSETNAVEVDQKIAESKANEDMIAHLQQYADSVVQPDVSQYSFDFSVCQVAL